MHNFLTSTAPGYMAYTRLIRNLFLLLHRLSGTVSCKVSHQTHLPNNQWKETPLLGFVREVLRNWSLVSVGRFSWSFSFTMETRGVRTVFTRLLLAVKETRLLGVRLERCMYSAVPCFGSEQTAWCKRVWLFPAFIRCLTLGGIAGYLSWWAITKLTFVPCCLHLGTGQGRWAGD